MTENKHPFIEYLNSLVQQDRRGALAELRRGLGQPPGACASMYRYIVPFLPEKCSRRSEAIYYLIGALFASHPDNATAGNMGAHLAAARSENGGEALERRFTCLLASHIDDLPDYLRQTIGFLKSKNVPVNWQQLFWDLQQWDNEERSVQKHWANAFWGRQVEKTPEKES